MKKIKTDAKVPAAIMGSLADENSGVLGSYTRTVASRVAAGKKTIHLANGFIQNGSLCQSLGLKPSVDTASKTLLSAPWTVSSRVSSIFFLKRFPCSRIEECVR